MDPDVVVLEGDILRAEATGKQDLVKFLFIPVPNGENVYLIYRNQE